MSYERAPNLVRALKLFFATSNRHIALAVGAYCRFGTVPRHWNRCRGILNLKRRAIRLCICRFPKSGTCVCSWSLTHIYRTPMIDHAIRITSLQLQLSATASYRSHALHSQECDL